MKSIWRNFPRQNFLEIKPVAFKMKHADRWIRLSHYASRVTYIINSKRVNFYNYVGRSQGHSRKKCVRTFVKSQALPPPLALQWKHMFVSKQRKTCTTSLKLDSSSPREKKKDMPTTTNRTAVLTENIANRKHRKDVVRVEVDKMCL